MHEAGEAHLREEIRQIVAKGKADKRQLNSNAACILERGDVLADLKRKRDEKDAQKQRHPRQTRKRTTVTARTEAEICEPGLRTQ
jgi:hypothetical protein